MTPTIESSVTFFIEEIDFELTHESELSVWLLDLALESKKSVALLEYIFCSDDYLLDINKQHLNHDFYTDIITFPLSHDPIEATIFISIDRINDNAENLGQTFVDELHRVMCHGLLHLLGFNDKTKVQQTEMRKKENEALAKRTWLMSVS